MTGLSSDNFLDSIFSLEKYITAEDYRGYDPYDGLMSPIFRLPVLRSSKTLRLYSQQILKRLPFNARPLLFIKKGLNPVTLGLCAQGYTYLLKSGVEGRQFSAGYLESRIKSLIDLLIENSSKGFSGYCWGYDFDWEAKYASNPAYTPTVVATGIITNGLFEYYRYSKDAAVLGVLESAAEFITKDLRKNYEGNLFCYSYAPFDNQKVFNASMKAARLLAQMYSVNRSGKILEEADKAVSYVAENQRADGSWGYSKDDGREWTDNFHTGYILDCLDEYAKCTGKQDYDEILRKGYRYYSENFFVEKEKNGIKHVIPKYYNNRLYPTDSTAAAQSILTLSRFGDTDKAAATLDFMLADMYSKNNYFYYRAGKTGKIKTSYMRWSNAWMFCSMAYLYYKMNSSGYDLV